LSTVVAAMQISANPSDAGSLPDDALLRMAEVTVRFPGVLALDRVSLDVRAGEVHGLMGENGAGKSTVLKVLSGVYRPDSGHILLSGVTQHFIEPRSALAAGIAVIYQELHLVPELTVAENLLLGHFPARWGVIDRRRLVERALAELRRLGEDIDPTLKVKHLGIGQRQMVEIGKALSRDARVIAFDEPTSSLSSRETERLMAIIGGLKEQGRAILYVSHRMDEVYALCDRVTVFRDGKRVTTFDAVRDLDRTLLVQAMVGRSIQDIYGYRPRSIGEVKLEVNGLGGRGLEAPAHFKVHAGEIVGFFGLVGAGRSELMKLVYGAERPTCGEIRLNGRAVRCASPGGAIRAGIAFCPEDRKLEGIFPIASVADNLNVSCRRHHRRWGLTLDSRREKQTAQEYIDRLNIKTQDGGTVMGTLSGGNQQKVVLARWLAERIDVFLMDEPTRGIDIGARSEIYRLMYELAESGKALLIVSSDLAEVIGVSDRIVVMREGRIVGEIARTDATPERVIRMALPP
jgi:L-arabinose transport system ATP-binding protein